MSITGKGGSELDLQAEMRCNVVQIYHISCMYIYQTRAAKSLPLQLRNQQTWRATFRKRHRLDGLLFVTRQRRQEMVVAGGSARA